MDVVLSLLTVSVFSFCRQHKLDESLAYQQFSANVGEEESWINEKNTLVGSDDFGDTLAAVQVSLMSRSTILLYVCLQYPTRNMRKTKNSSR